MTEQARDFMAANDASPVISGHAIGKGGEGAYYVLQDNRTFTLSVDDCRALPEPYPKWAPGVCPPPSVL